MLDVTVNSAATDINVSTYGAGSFVLRNTGEEPISSVSIDLSNSLFSNASSAMVYDPTGAAGDETAKGFTNDGGEGDYTVSAELSGGSDEDGYALLTLSFSSFAPGESLQFSIDIDPDSIQGAAGDGDAGSVSGLELSGATVTVTYANGETSTSTLFADGSQGGAVASVSTDDAAAPALSFGDTSGTVAVDGTSQTININGSASETVTVLAAVGTLGNGVPAGSLFDANTAADVAYYEVTLDETGRGTLTVEVPGDAPLYLSAAVREAEGQWGAASAPLILAQEEASDGIDATIISETSEGDIAVVDAGVGAEIYGDRAYTISELPEALADARLIQTNNDGPERVITGPNYVTFEVNESGYAYVAYDVRGTPPAWLTSGWVPTGETVTTSEIFGGNESLRDFALYGKAVVPGEEVVIGGPEGTDTNFSNLFAFVDDSDLLPPPLITVTAIEVLENVPGAIVADIDVQNIMPAPTDPFQFDLTGDAAEQYEVVGDATDGFQLKLIETAALDFEAVTSPTVNVSYLGSASGAFTPEVANDFVDDVPQGEIDATITAETSSGDIAVINAVVGAPVYGDRDYSIAELPEPLSNARLIRTNNDGADRAIDGDDYVTFTANADGYAYVAFDARATTLPAWLTEGWVATGQTVTTLETFGGPSNQAFDLYGRAISEGEDVTIGGADAANAVVPGGGFSNLFAFVDDSDLIPVQREISLTPIEVEENVAGAVVADIALANVEPTPTSPQDFTLSGDDAALFEVVGSAEDGFQLKLVEGAELDFEATAQPSVTVTAGGISSGAFSPSVADDPSDNAPVDATITSEASYADIAVVDAAEGVTVYGDRDYPIADLPQELANARLIQTNNGGPGEAPTEAEQDRFSTADSGYVVFETSAAGYVYVAYDARATTIPGWLQDGWTATDNVVTVTETFGGAETPRDYVLYGKAVGANETVDLGGADRAGSGAAISNYFALVDDSNLGVPELGENPLAPGDDSFALPEDSISVPLAVELNDPEGTAITGFTDPEHGTLELIDGVLHYTPDEDYSNQEFDGTDSFIYTIEDGDGRTGEASVDLLVERSHEQPQANVDNWDVPSDGVNPVADIPLTDEQREAAERQMEDLAPEITPSGLEMVVSRFARLPGVEPSMLGWATLGDRIFVQAQDRGAPLDNNGIVYEMARNDDGSVSVVEFFNIGQTFNQLPVDLAGSSSFSDGVRGFTFHPEFLEEGAEGYGKFYFTGRVSREPGVDYDFMSAQEGHYGPDSAVIEFTYDFDAGAFDPDSYREVTRIAMNVPWKHPIKDLMFNPYAEKGDADYGNLYFMMGDGYPNETSIREVASQNNDAIGKVIRLNPLETTDGEPYSIPSDNPFVGNDDWIDEIYAIGLRNQHDISFYQAPDGEVHIILTGVGYDHADEVNIITPGANLGWALRDGHWIPIQDGGNTTGLLPLPEDEWELGLTYPTTFVAHDPYGKGGIGNVGDVFQALAGGHVINNGSELDGQYIFADFAESSKVFHASIEDMLNAKTTLAEGEDPSELSWATPHELTILYNHDNDPSTTPIVQPSFKEVVNDYRSDVRFGEGPQGELYVMNKRDGWVYLVENSTPEGFQMPTGVSDVADPPENPFLNASSDYLKVEKGDATFLLDDGSNRGLMNNDTFPGNEPSITAVNGGELTVLNSTGRLSGTFAGSNGGTFTVAAGGAVNFATNGDFDDLAADESITTSIEYTITAADGSQTDTATVVVTVRGEMDVEPTIENFTENSDLATSPALSTVQVGNPVYADRDYTLSNYPDVLSGAQFITTNNDDKNLVTDDLLTFELAAEGYVYVAFDTRATSLPSWFDEEWIETGERIQIEGFEGATENYVVYGKAFDAGETVSLGGNELEATGALSHYLVAVSDVAMFVPAADAGGDTPPVALDGTETAIEDTAVTIDLAELISDREDGTPNVVEASSENGSVTLDGTSLTFVPEADFNGDASITYTVEDSNGRRATGEIAVEVAPVNDAPTISGSLAGVTVTETDGATVDLSGLEVADIDTDASDLTLGVRLVGGGDLPDGVSIDPETQILTLPAGLGGLDLEIFANDGALDSEGVVRLAVNGGAPLPEGGITVDFNAANITSYTSQDGAGSVVVSEGGESLQLDGNLWKRASLPENYEITSESRLRLTLDPGTVPSEIVAIGFDLDEDFSDRDGSIYQLTGTQNYGRFVGVDGTDNGDGTTTYVIDLSAHSGITIDSLVFVADDDNSRDGLGTPSFSNVSLFEAEAENTAPRAVGGGIADIAVNEGSPLEIDLPFIDDDGDALSYSVSVTDSAAAPVTLEGLTIEDGVLTGSVPRSPGTYTVTVTAADPDGATAESTFDLTIRDVNDAPVSTDPALEPYFFEAGQAIDGIDLSAFDAYFTDPDAGDTLTLTAEDLPPGLSVDDEGVITGTPTSGGSYTVTIRATDQAGASATVTFDLRIDGEGGGVGEVVTVEAEDFTGLDTATGFYATGQVGASGDQIIRVAGIGEEGSVSTVLGQNGLTEGWYNVAMTRYDETDGSARYSLQIGDTVLAENAAFDGTSDMATENDTFDNTARRGNAGQPGNLKTLTFEAPVYIGAETLLTLTGTADAETLRTDKFTFTRVEAPVPPSGEISLSSNAVEENIADGVAIGTLSAEGLDGEVSYSVPADSVFEVTDNTLRLKAGESLDFESTPTVEVVVTATDEGGRSTQTVLTVAVSDTNDAPVSTDPALEPYLFEAGEAIIGIDLSDFEAYFSDPDAGDTLTLTAEGLPPGLSVDAQGVITGMPISGGNYTVTIRATDQAGASATMTFDLQIDGESGGGEGGEVITIEAEDLTGLDTATGFYAAPEAGASGDELIRVADVGDSGALATRLSENGLTEGWYNVAMTRYDETDGSARYSLRIGDTVLADNARFDAIPAGTAATDTFDNSDPRGNGGQSGNLKTLTFEAPVYIDDETLLTLSGRADREILRVDKFTFTRVGEADVPDGTVVLSANDVAENVADGAVIGSLSVSGASGEEITFTVPAEAPFEVVDGTLRLKAGQPLDFESSPSVDVVVTATGADGSSSDTVLTIDVGDVNDAPTLANPDALAPVTVQTGAGATVDLSVLGVSDEDAGDVPGYRIASASGAPLPDGIALDADGTGLVVPEDAPEGTYEISVFGTDGEADSGPALLTVTVTGAAAETIYEAEDALLSGDPAVIDQGTDDRNQSGSFVDFLGPDTETITWNVEVAQDGTYDLDILYALGPNKGPRPMDLSVDGAVVEALTFPSNSNEAESVWTPESTQITLSAGTHTISLTAPGGVGPNIDFLRLGSAPVEGVDDTADVGGDLDLVVLDASDAGAVAFQVNGLDSDIETLSVSFDGGARTQNVILDSENRFTADVGEMGEITAILTVTDDAANTASSDVTFAAGFAPVPNDGTETVGDRVFTVYEAENADLIGDPAVVAEDRGQRGGEFVDFTGTSSQSISWTVSVGQSGTYALDFLYALADFKASRPAEVSVNGTAQGTLPFAPNSNASETVWGPQSTELRLTAGTNTITMTVPDANGANIDYLRVSETPVDTFLPSYASIIDAGRIELEATDNSTRTIDDSSVRFFFTVDEDGLYALDLAANAGAPDGAGLSLLLSENGSVPTEIGDEAFPGAGDAGEETVYVQLQAGVEYGLTANSDAPGASALDYLDVRQVPGNANADIEIDSQDAGYFNDRLHFQWIDNPGSRVPDNPRAFKDSATVEFSNSGSETLDILETRLSGPFDLADPSILDGVSLAPGETISVEVLFDRDAYNAGGDGDYGVFEGDLELITNDLDSPVANVDLAGFWQRQDEGGQEPNLNEVWDVFGFGNTIEGLSLFGGGENSVLQFFDLYLPVDETEVLSPYWRLADGAQEATITQIAALHQPNPAFISMFAPGDKGALEGLTFHSPDWSQGLLPLNFELDGFSTASFDNGRIPDGWAGDDVFGLQIDGISTDPTLNATGGQTPTQAQLDARYPGYTVDAEGVVTAPDGSVVPYGYTVRMFQALDQDGDAIENVFLGTMDYTGINYDYNDNMFIIEGVTPVGFGGELSVSGLDDAAADDRLVFTNIELPDNRSGLPQTFRQDATITVTNDGFAPLELDDLSIEGASASAFEIVSGPETGDSLAAGETAQVTVRFIGADGVDDNRAVLYNDARLVITPDFGAAQTIALAGLAQLQSEAGEEPTVAQITAAFGYSTDMAQNELAGNGVVETVGDEILAPYLTALDGSQPVEVIQLAAFLQQTNVARLSLHDLDSADLTELFAADDQQGQTVLPDGLVYGEGDTGDVARASFTPDGAFGLKVTVDGRPTYASWTDPEINKIDPEFGQLVGEDQGHLIRYFQAKDAQGNDIPGTLIAIQDYPGAGNYDYNDHMFVIKNVSPHTLTEAQDANGNGVNDALETDVDGDGTVAFFDGNDQPVVQAPYPGPDAPVLSSDAVTIQFENYDSGGQGVAYNDTPGLQGFGTGGRPGSDVEVSGDGVVGFVDAGEWLEYTVEVDRAGTYELSTLYARGFGGAITATVTAALADTVYETVTASYGGTGGWGSFAESAPLELDLQEGTNVLRFAFGGGGVDLDAFTLTPILEQNPVSGTPAAIAADGSTALLLADTFDFGGQGVSWNDNPGQDGGGGRPDTDVEVIGSDIAYVQDGEWVEYSIDVAASGWYDLSVNAKTPIAGNSVSISLEGGDPLAVFDLPDSNGASTGFGGTTFGDTPTQRVYLDEGTQILRATFEGSAADNGYILDYRSMSLTAAPGQTPYPGPEAPQLGDGGLRVEASAYDEGGQGLSWNDAPGLQGGTDGGRTGTDVEHTPAGDIGWIGTGEWLEYTIDVAEAGLYDLFAELATPFDDSGFDIDLYRVENGQQEEDPYLSLLDIETANTGNWTGFEEVFAGALDMEAGEQILRITFEGGQDFSGFMLV